jgi:alkaline phosphatase
MYRKILAVLFLFLLAFISGFPAQAAQNRDSGRNNPQNLWQGEHPKYVFMFIGDGLGLQQISAAEAYLAALEPETRGKPGIIKLSFGDFPAQGLCTTYSANSFITDSAPAATSLATGYKTDNGVIGLDPGKTRSFATVAELAKKSGMRVGIVSTVSLNHATPASYYAHQPSRNSYYEIGMQLVKSGFDYFAGGGILQHNAKDSRGNPRASLYEVAAQDGFVVLRDRASIMSASFDGKPILAVNPDLDRDSAMPYALDKKDGDVSLSEFVQKGIEVLSNDRGFFFMVEGGKIDWACHANDAATSIMDTLAFDQSIRVALDFAAAHPAETLIVVTGDHETGGMALGFAGTEYASFFEKIAFQKKSFLEFDKHIAALRSAKGASATLADMEDLIRENFGLLFLSPGELAVLKEAAGKDAAARARYGMALNADERRQLASALGKSMQGDRIKDATTHDFLLYGGYEPLSIQITHILNNKAGIGWTSYAHTGIPVPVYAVGIGNELFRGYYDNTDIAWKLFSIMGITPTEPTAYVSMLP